MQTFRCVAAALALLISDLAAAQPSARPPAADPPLAESPAPDGLPDDIPLYARAIPISSMASAERGTIVNLRSADTPEQIFTWYRAEFPRRGWIVEKQDATGRQHLVTALKTGRKASLLISAKPAADGAAPTESQILLVVTEER